MPPNNRPISHRESPVVGKGSYIKGSRAKTLEKKERREFLHGTLFADGVDPLQEEDIPLPPPRTPGSGRSIKTPRSTGAPQSGKRLNRSPPSRPDIAKTSRSKSRSPPPRSKSDKRRFSLSPGPLSRRKSLTSSPGALKHKKTVNGEQSESGKNRAGRSRKVTRRFSMGKKPKKRDNPSVSSDSRDRDSSKKSLHSEEGSVDRRKSINLRAKSDGLVLTAMKNSLQIASDSDSEASEREEEDDGQGLLTRGLQRLERFYEESLNG